MCIHLPTQFKEIKGYARTYVTSKVWPWRYEYITTHEKVVWYLYKILFREKISSYC